MQSHSGRLVNAKRQFEEQKIYDAFFILGKKIALRVVMHVYTKRENKIDKEEKWKGEQEQEQKRKK